MHIFLKSGNSNIIQRQWKTSPSPTAECPREVLPCPRIRLFSVRAVLLNRGLKYHILTKYDAAEKYGRYKKKL